MECLYVEKPRSATNVPEELSLLLNDAQAALSRSSATTVVSKLIDDLNMVRHQASAVDWRDILVPAARQHPICQMLQECPMTGRSYQRPRGYPGDAALLDVIYRHQDARGLLGSTSPLGEAIFSFTYETHAAAAVRIRRNVVANAVDDLAGEVGALRVLSVACGHMREIENSQALKNGGIVEWLGIDQDAESIARALAYADRKLPIRAAQMSVARLMLRRRHLGNFNLVYSAGLFDYLDQRTAKRLTSLMFEMLLPGGQLLVANFLDSPWEASYMETYMRWPLIYRSPAEIRQFAEGLPAGLVEKTEYFDDGLKRIGYLKVTRR